MAYLIGVFEKKTGAADTKNNKKALQKLRREVERAKKVLSGQTQTRIEIEAFHSGHDLVELLTRARFEELNLDLFKKIYGPMEHVLKDAKLEKHQIAEVILVGGSTRIPKVQSLIREFFNGKEPNRGVNPDEAVAMGAAIQGGILQGAEGTGDLVFLDVTALSQGIETVGGLMTVLIPRNTNVPTAKSQIFSTAQDNQDKVLIQVYEGERPMTRDNHLLGTFTVQNIAPAPRGVPQIEVTFDVDVNGVLTVRAVDKGSGKMEQMVIQRDTGRLSPQEVERMLAEAQEFADMDKLAKEVAQARNELEAGALEAKAKAQATDPAFPGAAKVKTVATEVLEWLVEHPRATKEEIAVQRAILVEAIGTPPPSPAPEKDRDL